MAKFSDMPVTDQVRHTARYLIIVTIVAAIGGWLLNKDPSQLVPILTSEIFMSGIGELSNVGKRYTTKPELLTNESTKTTP